MTELELNMNLERIERQRLDAMPAVVPSQRVERNYRRAKRIQKNDRLMKIVMRHYIPHAGYLDFDFEGKTLLHTGKYIKFPKDSNCQRWIKRQTNKRIRICQALSAKGNSYRRLFDYWWTLY